MSHILEQHKDTFFQTTVNLQEYEEYMQKLMIDDPLKMERAKQRLSLFLQNQNPAVTRILMEIIDKLKRTLGVTPTVHVLPKSVEEIRRDFPYDELSTIKNAYDEILTTLIDTAASNFFLSLQETEREALKRESEKAEADDVHYYIADYYLLNIARD